MKKRLFMVLSIVFIINSVFSTYAVAASVKRGAALNAVIGATKNESFKVVTKKKAYKAFKDNKSFNKKLKNNINIALANKIVKKSKKFFAKKAVKRIDLAKWIYASMKQTGYNFTKNPFKSNPKKFKDVKKKADKKVVRYLHKYGVMNGVSKKKFAPKKKVSKKVFKKIAKNLKKAIDNRKIPTSGIEPELPTSSAVPSTMPTENVTAGVTASTSAAPTLDVSEAPSAVATTTPSVTPIATPNVTSNVEPNVTPSVEPAPSEDAEETSQPSVKPTSEATGIPVEPTATAIPEVQDKLTQFVSNALMETTTDYETVGDNEIHHVKGYIGNGIKVLAGEEVKTTLQSVNEAKGKSIDFGLDIKKASSEDGSITLSIKAVGAQYDETIMTLNQNDFDNITDWNWFNEKVTLPNNDNITGFEISIVAEDADFVIDNLNVLHAVKGNYISRAYYESEDYVIRAQVDHENGIISAFVPASGSYELKTDVIGTESAAVALYESKVTKVESGNEQLTLTKNYEASADNAGKVDYNVTIDGIEYVLFANNEDDSGMRNYLAFTKAQLFVPNGDWTGQLLTSSVCKFVDLFADDQYLGVYTMVEDITKKNIENLEFMVEFNATEGNNTVGNKKYRVVNNGTMSAADVQDYLEDVDDAFLAYNTATTTSQKNAADANFDALVDIQSYIDWTLFNEYFVTKNATFNKNVYAYKLKDGKLQFAVWDDYSLSCGNDSSITIKEDSYYHVWLSDWGKALMNQRINYPQQIYDRWYYCRWYVFNKFDNQFATFTEEVNTAYSYDTQLWGTTLDGVDSYGEWMKIRIEWLKKECSGY